MELRGVLRVEGNNDANCKLIFHDVSGEKADKVYKFYTSNKNLPESNNSVYPVDNCKVKTIGELKKIYQCSFLYLVSVTKSMKTLLR